MTIIWLFLSGFCKWEQRAKKCIDFRGEYVEYISSLVVVACFLPARAKEISTPPSNLNWQLPCLRWSVATEAHVWAWIIQFGIREAKKCPLCLVFSWYFPFPCHYPYTNTTYSHYNHRPHNTISQIHPPVSTLTLTLPTHTITTFHTTKSHNSIPLSVPLQ